MKQIKSMLYYIVVGFLILYILMISLSPEKMMDVFGFRPFVVLSESMDPVIAKNDMIISKEASKDTLEVGDIITFKAYIKEVDSISYVTHYIGDIIEVGDTTIYKTHGEGVEGFDIWRDSNDNIYDITFEDVEGEYLFKVPYIGNLQGLLTNKVFVGVVILNITIIFFTVKYIKGKPEEDEI